jgi:hypothetical protein
VQTRIIATVRLKCRNQTPRGEKLGIFYHYVARNKETVFTPLLLNEQLESMYMLRRN